MCDVAFEMPILAFGVFQVPDPAEYERSARGASDFDAVAPLDQDANSLFNHRDHAIVK